MDEQAVMYLIRHRVHSSYFSAASDGVTGNTNDGGPGWIATSHPERGRG